MRASLIPDWRRTHGLHFFRHITMASLTIAVLSFLIVMRIELQSVQSMILADHDAVPQASATVSSAIAPVPPRSIGVVQGQMSAQPKAEANDRPTRNLEKLQWAFMIAAFSAFVLLLRQLQASGKLYADLKKREAEIRHLATLDPLTGLNNRRHFDERMRAIDEGQWPGECQLLLIDLDGFKQINDLYGHEAGDYVLKETAARIRQTASANAVLARLGGDEFAIAFAGPLDRACATANQIISELKQPFLYASASLSVGASIGIATGNISAKTSVCLLREADKALYAAKARGRGRYVVFDGEPLPECRSAA